MTGEPISTSLLIASAASTGASMIASGKQEKLDLAMINAETERAKLQATDQALVQAQTFRQALASQLAISSLRSGGGGSIARQFGAQSVANFLRDQNALQSTKNFIDIASKGNIATAKSQRLTRDFNAINNLINTGMGAINLSKTLPGTGNKGGSL